MNSFWWLVIGMIVGISLSWWWNHANLKQLLQDLAQQVEDKIKR